MSQRVAQKYGRCEKGGGENFCSVGFMMLVLKKAITADVVQLSVASTANATATKVKAARPPRLLIRHVIVDNLFINWPGYITYEWPVALLVSGLTLGRLHEGNAPLETQKFLPKIVGCSSQCEGSGLIIAIDHAQGSSTRNHSDFYRYAQAETHQAPR